MNNSDRLKNLEHRIAKLRERVTRQKDGPEVEIAQRILSGLQAQYRALQKGKEIIPETTSTKRFDGLSDEELAQKLGAIYLIFGPSYEENFSLHNYRIEFLEIVPSSNDSCVMTVMANIYEDDLILISNAKIEFWQDGSDDCTINGADSAEVEDIGISRETISRKTSTKYRHHWHWFEKLAYSLAKTWNKYFKNVPMLEAKTGGYIDAK